MPHFLRFCALLAFVALTGTTARAQTLARVSTDTAPATSVPAALPLPVALPVYPDSVYINPEVRPQFVGGEKGLTAYLSKSIRYPEQALQRHVSGRVFVSFVLNAQGRVVDAHVLRGPGCGLNDEALRLVWLMPLWEPARVNGQPVRVACTLPISFDTQR